MKHDYYISTNFSLLGANNNTNSVQITLSYKYKNGK